MPDTHQGYGMPIGGVIACMRHIIPNAVGVDIGCGMNYVKTVIPIEVIKECKTSEGTPLLREFVNVALNLLVL